MNNSKDDANKKVASLAEAAQRHIGQHGVVIKKTGQRVRHGKILEFEKPKLVLPGLPTPQKSKPGSRLGIVRNNTNTLVKIKFVVEGHVMGEAIMNAQTFEQFIHSCQQELARMKEGPKGPTDVSKG